MLDINFLKNNVEYITKKLIEKNADVSKINQLILLDDKYKNNKIDLENLLAKRNKLSNDIAICVSKNESKIKIDELKKEVLSLKDNIESLTEISNNLEKEINEILFCIPNICDDSVPVGKNEEFNKEIKKFLEPTKFNFVPKAHWDLANELDLYLNDVATKITGTRFITYYDQGARLYRALQQFTLDLNTKNKFIEVLPQVIVNEKSLFGSGQLPKFKDDLFKLENLNYYLSPTAEVQLTNIYRNNIIDLEQLPIKLTANTSCFRSEAGSAGKDTRGAIRLHQFHKSELMVYSHPDHSYEMLEEITRTAETILEKLNLPYRRIVLCTGDTGFSSAKTYDIEVWLPSYNSYKEISSCSNCTDFQARRAKIRFKDNDNSNKLVHTLNGSSLAIDRLWVAVVENYQNEDGSITIPDVLIPYMNGIKKITKK